jgi:hypothetical protein
MCRDGDEKQGKLNDQARRRRYQSHSGKAHLTGRDLADRCASHVRDNRLTKAHTLAVGINHTRSYADGDNHTRHIESAFSLLKRGVVGRFHEFSIKHLQRYCDEFSDPFNRRGIQLQMFDSILKNLTRGEVLLYKKLTAKT